MDSFSAMIRGQAAARIGAPQRVFDWEKAAKLIVERKPKRAEAGLAGDWEYTGGPIWSDGRPVPSESTYVYLSSNWATPQVALDGERIDCWRFESETPGWNSDTYWPPEALALLPAAAAEIVTTATSGGTP